MPKPYACTPDDVCAPVGGGGFSPRSNASHYLIVRLSDIMNMTAAGFISGRFCRDPIPVPNTSKGRRH